MSFSKIRQHMYKYIGKTEYTMAVSVVFSFICSILISGYSNYLSDRNERIDRLNKKPLNHIWINYITLEEYEYMINKNNWKPANLKKEQQNTNKKQKNFIETLNGWLLNQAKQKERKSEVKPESLKKLAELNKMPYIEEKVQELQEQENNLNIKKDSKIPKNTIRERNILPPIRRKKEEQRYFVVQEAGSNIRHNPLEFRKNNKKQNVKVSTENNKIGEIAGKDIKKDRNIFESLIKIWRAVLYKKEKKNGQVINTGYDQYGNKILTKKIKNNNISNTYEENNAIQNYSNNIEEGQQIIFLNPTFIIDGNIQNAESSKFKENAIKNNLNANEIRMLTYLEYTFEKCWYEKKQKNSINAEISLFYNKDKSISSIEYKTNNKDKKLIENMIKTMITCKISNVINLTEKNYNLWGKINIKLIN